MQESVAFQNAIADFLRSFRTEHRLTLDDVARQAREFGAGWGVSTVRNFESARSAVTLPNLLVLAASLNALAGSSLTLDDLLGDTATFSAPSVHGAGVTREWVRSALAGAPVRLSLTDTSSQLLDSDRLLDMLEAVGREMPVGWYVPGPDEPAPREPTLAEQRAADRLGMLRVSFAAWADRLWGRSLDEEAAIRASSNSPQARGRATRALVEEVSKHYEERIKNG
ncbi:helix-turn-helix transcriptional regulator [Microbacterium sp. ISL-59]|nr:helix-turn-helix transcriptional regulator [Microbacterium sp. ISL-59]